MITDNDITLLGSRGSSSEIEGNSINPRNDYSENDGDGDGDNDRSVAGMATQKRGLRSSVPVTPRSRATSVTPSRRDPPRRPPPATHHDGVRGVPLNASQLSRLAPDQTQRPSRLPPAVPLSRGRGSQPRRDQNSATSRTPPSRTPSKYRRELLERESAVKNRSPSPQEPQPQQQQTVNKSGTRRSNRSSGEDSTFLMLSVGSSNTNTDQGKNDEEDLEQLSMPLAAVTAAEMRSSGVKSAAKTRSGAAPDQVDDDDDESTFQLMTADPPTLTENGEQKQKGDGAESNLNTSARDLNSNDEDDHHSHREGSADHVSSQPPSSTRSVELFPQFEPLAPKTKVTGSEPLGMAGKPKDPAHRAVGDVERSLFSAKHVEPTAPDSMEASARDSEHGRDDAASETNSSRATDAVLGTEKTATQQKNHLDATAAFAEGDGNAAPTPSSKRFGIREMNKSNKNLHNEGPIANERMILAGPPLTSWGADDDYDFYCASYVNGRVAAKGSKREHRHRDRRQGSQQHHDRSSHAKAGEEASSHNEHPAAPHAFKRQWLLQQRFLESRVDSGGVRDEEDGNMTTLTTTKSTSSSSSSTSSSSSSSSPAPSRSPDGLRRFISHHALNVHEEESPKAAPPAAAENTDGLAARGKNRRIMLPLDVVEVEPGAGEDEAVTSGGATPTINEQQRTASAKPNQRAHASTHAYPSRGVPFSFHAQQGLFDRDPQGVRPHVSVSPREPPASKWNSSPRVERTPSQKAGFNGQSTTSTERRKQQRPPWQSSSIPSTTGITGEKHSADDAWRTFERRVEMRYGVPHTGASHSPNEGGSSDPFASPSRWPAEILFSSPSLQPAATGTLTFTEATMAQRTPAVAGGVAAAPLGVANPFKKSVEARLRDMDVPLTLLVIVLPSASTVASSSQVLASYQRRQPGAVWQDGVAGPLCARVRIPPHLFPTVTVNDVKRELSSLLSAPVERMTLRIHGSSLSRGTARLADLQHLFRFPNASSSLPQHQQQQQAFIQYSSSPSLPSTNPSATAEHILFLDIESEDGESGEEAAADEWTEDIPAWQVVRREAPQLPNRKDETERATRVATQVLHRDPATEHFQTHPMTFTRLPWSPVRDSSTVGSVTRRGLRGGEEENTERIHSNDLDRNSQRIDHNSPRAYRSEPPSFEGRPVVANTARNTQMSENIGSGSGSGGGRNSEGAIHHVTALEEQALLVRREVLRQLQARATANDSPSPPPKRTPAAAATGINQSGSRSVGSPLSTANASADSMDHPIGMSRSNHAAVQPKQDPSTAWTNSDMQVSSSASPQPMLPDFYSLAPDDQEALLDDVMSKVTQQMEVLSWMRHRLDEQRHVSNNPSAVKPNGRGLNDGATAAAALLQLDGQERTTNRYSSDGAPRETMKRTQQFESNRSSGGHPPANAMGDARRRTEEEDDEDVTNLSEIRSVSEPAAVQQQQKQRLRAGEEDPQEAETPHRVALRTAPTRPPPLSQEEEEGGDDDDRVVRYEETERIVVQETHHFHLRHKHQEQQQQKLSRPMVVNSDVATIRDENRAHDGNNNEEEDEDNDEESVDIFFERFLTRQQNPTAQTPE